MRLTARSLRQCLLAAALANALSTLAAAPLAGSASPPQAESDALELEAPAPAGSEARALRLLIEAAVGRASQRYLPYARDSARISLDLSHSAAWGNGLRSVVSDRLDQMRPVSGDAPEMVNSLREAYASWQSGDGDTLVEAGRINLRFGPGFGYNPTDFFRDGSLRTLTTVDPVALRENRMGSVMLRAQAIRAGSSFSLAYSPKLAERPSRGGLGLDLGSTNSRARLLAAAAGPISPSLSGRLLAYRDDGAYGALGANLSALVSDAAVMHLEWSGSSEPDLLARAQAGPTAKALGASALRNRLVLGGTYTTLSKWSLTAEYQYNGFGLGQSAWAALGATPLAQRAYLQEALRRQELAPRQAYLLHAARKGLLLKSLDLGAYLRINPGDGSRLGWIELRQHWSSADLSLQLQDNRGRPASEFGLLPERRSVQLLGTYYY